MDYNYYPPQPGLSTPSVNNPQHGTPQMQQQPGPIMHAPMTPQNIRQAMSPSPSSHLQHQQHLSHLSQQRMSPQQQHQNYQVHPHGPPVSHAGSPHPQQQHHNHQLPISGLPPQQSPIPAQHHLHSPSPHHHGGPHMHSQQQQMNQMVRPPLGPSMMNHPQSNMQHSHHQNFFNTGSIPQNNMHHYPQQQNQHLPHHQPQTQPLPSQQQQQHHHHHHHHQQQQQQHHQHQSPNIHHAQPISHHHIHLQQGIERNSPYYPSILQTEFRIIEFNRRLQCRPISRHSISPLPNHPFDESLWWERFASDFFEDDATLTLRSIQDDKPLEYTIGRTLIPRFFRTYFDGGVTDLSINLKNPKEVCLSSNLITLDCDQAFIVTNNIFKHPAIPSNHSVVVHTEGHLILDFVSNNYDALSIKSWKFFTRGCREYIDRSMTAMGLPNTLLIDPLTRQQGLTKSTISYLKMCMIMEPMQDMMFQHKANKLDPKICLRRFLIEKYKYKPTDEIRAVVVTNKRRKRKPSAVPNIPGAPTTATNKKTKTSINNHMGNNSGLNNNTLMMSPSGGSSTFTLASQDVMVVGEPSMMGGDFVDDNERIIPRLENTQYDPSASTPSIAEEQDSIHISGGNNNCLSNNGDANAEKHSSSPSLVQQRNQQTSVVMPQHDKIENQSLHNGSVTAQHSPVVQTNGQDRQDSMTVNQLNMVEPNGESIQQTCVDQSERNSSDGTVQEELNQEVNNVEYKQSEEEESKDNNHKYPVVDEVFSKNQTDNADEIYAKSDEHKVQSESSPRQQDHKSSDVKLERVEETNSDKSSILDDETRVHASEDAIEKENNFVLNDETQMNSTATQSENHMNIMNSIPEDREDTCRSTSCDSLMSKLPPTSNNKNALTTNGSSNKQNRRRSSERKETLREGLMRTSDFVVAMKDLKCEHPALWRITTGNNLLQQFEPKTQNGIVLYENTNQYAGWNPEIKKDYVGVDVKLTQHTRNQITVERLLLNFQKLEDADAFYDKHFVIYLQILISTALDSKFWESIENEPKHHDYFLTSRRIVEDIIKQFKIKLSNKLKLSEATLKNIEKYPNLLIKPTEKDEKEKICRACNTNLSTQLVTFENRSYDLHSYKPVKVTSEPKTENNVICEACLEIVKLYSKIHHMGWKLYNLAREKVELHRTKGKPINAILDECLKDEEWLTSIYAERDAIWSKVEQIQ